ncbi:MAG: hypothetical protein ABH967_00365 [Patescibacteria group bacterium]
MDPIETRDERVHGFWVTFGKDLWEGITYLSRDLQFEEAKTLFDAARLRGNAEFEDDDDRDWTLTYIRGKNSYVLTLRDRE